MLSYFKVNFLIIRKMELFYRFVTCIYFSVGCLLLAFAYFHIEVFIVFFFKEHLYNKDANPLYIMYFTFPN